MGSVPRLVPVLLVSAAALAAAPVPVPLEAPVPLRALAGEGDRHMCVFCHALEAGRAPAQPPAWQPSVGQPYAYSPFPGADSGTLGQVPADGSRSVVCLACHDTGQGPGQGAFRNGHPFAVPYRGAGVDETLLELARGPDYAWRRSARVIGTMSFRPARRASRDGNVVWSVPVPGLADGLPLFTRSDGPWDGVPFIECTTCHDPHSENRLLLRAPTAQSRLCLSCHNI